jgi:hypothetical protein
MHRRAAVVFTAALTTWAAIAAAQIEPTPADGRGRWERYDNRQRQQKLDDAIRKFTGEDAQERLEASEGLGENAEDPKAVEYPARGGPTRTSACA